MFEFAVSEGCEKKGSGETSQKEKGITDRQWVQPKGLKGDRFYLSTRPHSPNTMARRVFEIDELAKYKPPPLFYFLPLKTL